MKLKSKDDNKDNKQIQGLKSKCIRWNFLKYVSLKEVATFSINAHNMWEIKHRTGLAGSEQTGKKYWRCKLFLSFSISTKNNKEPAFENIPCSIDYVVHREIALLNEILKIRQSQRSGTSRYESNLEKIKQLADPVLDLQTIPSELRDEMYRCHMKIDSNASCEAMSFESNKFFRYFACNSYTQL